jgi:putative ABC transport system permease protein
MFGKDPGVIGRVVTVNGEPYTVIGVMPADFAFAPFWATHAELWAPLALGPRLYDTGGWSLRVFGRLKPGHSLASARAEIASITADMERRFPHSNDDVRVRPLADLVVGSVRTPLYVVLGAVAFVLLIACANVAHMLLARGASRQREIAVRAALGASRGRTLRQLLTESLALALVGGCAGILLAIGGVRVLSVLGATSIPRVQSTTVDFRVLVAALVISAGTALAFGLVPALRATHVNLSESLKEGNRGANDAGSGGRLRNLLVVSEFALALVLLVGAGLMVRTFAALTSHDPGFNPHDVLSAQVSVAGTAEAAPGARLAFYDALLGRLRGVPGVTAVSAINHLPLAGDLWGRSFRPEGRSEPKSGIWPVAVYRVVFPGYFAAMRLPLVRGRDFTDRDAMGAPGVVIVNEHLADRSWPGEDAIGKRLALADDDSAAPNWLTVVGVVRDAAQETLTDPMQPEMYLPIRQRADYLSGSELHYSYVTVVARVGCPPGREPCDAGAVGGALRAAAAGLDPQVTVSSVETMDAVMHDATARPRFYLTLLLTFAVVALVLAAVGIYGVTSYGVSRRTHEIGLRLALGARPAQLLGSVVAESMKVAVAGALVGALGAYALARLLSGILFGVRAHDPITFVSVTLLLCAVALVASYLPARRATRIEPLTALRGE